MKEKDYELKVYAGVLGKQIGVYFGRPVEGWPFDMVQKEFGYVDRYLNQELNMPIIVPDDDISGTFTFLNAAEDAEDLSELTAEHFGETWLNYVIEDKTIFWWGGLGRSTEHTAYLRLKSGLKAPKSGSVLTNGKTVSEQIGAQIFIDAIAMLFPNDPEKAMHYVQEAARVSHDGIAVAAAGMLGAMESLAFAESDLQAIIDKAEIYCTDEIRKIVDDVRNQCIKQNDWFKIRLWLDKHYGYHLYPGNCHVVPNFSLIMASLILGGDSFAKAMQIVVSSAWDTDCNAANLGCLNGIRLGLDHINEEFDFRGPIADRMYQISADGGACVSDAVRQTKRIVRISNRLNHNHRASQSSKRFSFDYPGSVQGFVLCPYFNNESRSPENIKSPENILLDNAERGLRIGAGEAISTPVFWDPEDRYGGYCLVGSPILYSGQSVNFELYSAKPSSFVPYVLYYDFDDCVQILWGPRFDLDGLQTFEWRIPDLKGCTLSRLGIKNGEKQASSEENSIILLSADWNGAPDYFSIKGSLRNFKKPKPNMQLNSFTSSAKQFSFDAVRTFTVSHTENNGIAAIGTEDWRDYKISTVLTPGLHKRMGVIGRSKGLRKYYALVFSGLNQVQIIMKDGSMEKLLCEKSFPYKLDSEIEVELSLKDSEIKARINRSVELVCSDETYKKGACGFMIDKGTFLADGFTVEAL